MNFLHFLETIRCEALQNTLTLFVKNNMHAPSKRSPTRFLAKADVTRNFLRGMVLSLRSNNADTSFDIKGPMSKEMANFSSLKFVIHFHSRL